MLPRWLLMNSGSGIPQDFESFHSFAVDATDATGNHDGTLSGDANISGGYLVLDGSGDYVQTNAYPATAQVTASAIFNLSTLGDRGVIFGDSDGISANTRVTLYVTAANTWGIQLGDGSSYWFDESVVHGLSINTDYEVQLEINGTSVKLRVDGVEALSKTSTVALSSLTTTPWSIGRLGSYSGAANFFFAGKIKSVYRYHRLLSSIEQQALTDR